MTIKWHFIVVLSGAFSCLYTMNAASSRISTTKLAMPKPCSFVGKIACLDRDFVDDTGEAPKGEAVADTPCHINGEIVYNCQDIVIKPGGSITIHHNSVLILQNATLSGVSDESLLFEDEMSFLVLDNAEIDIDCYRGYRFNRGTIVISGVCALNGEDWFCCCPTVVEWDDTHAAIVRRGNATLELDELEVYRSGLSRSYTIENAFRSKDFTQLPNIVDKDVVGGKAAAPHGDEKAPLLVKEDQPADPNDGATAADDDDAALHHKKRC